MYLLVVLDPIRTAKLKSFDFTISPTSSVTNSPLSIVCLDRSPHPLFSVRKTLFGIFNKTSDNFKKVRIRGFKSLLNSVLDHSIWAKINVAGAHVVAFLNKEVVTGRNFVHVESIFFVHVVHGRLRTETCACTISLAYTRNTVVDFAFYSQVALSWPGSEVWSLVSRFNKNHSKETHLES